MQVSEERETLKSALASSEKYSVFIADLWKSILYIVPGYFGHTLEIAGQAVFQGT